MSAGGFSPYRESARALPRLIYRPLLRDRFSAVVNLAVIRTKAVYTLKDKGNPAIKSDSSHIHIICYIYQACAVQNCIYNSTLLIVFTINMCTILSVACSLHQRERRKCFDQNPPSCVSLYTHAHLFGAP
jgi:hypothetical protein